MGEEKKKIKDLETGDLDLEVGMTRRYNLGGFNNYIEISHKVNGSAETIKDYDNINKIMEVVTFKMGKAISNARIRIKNKTKEEYEDDGKVLDSREDDE